MAALPARVDVDESPVFDSPPVARRTIGAVRRGERIAVSNVPTRGFYKVRTQDGTIGWVSARDLVIQKQTSGGSTRPTAERAFNNPFDGGGEEIDPNLDDPTVAPRSNAPAWRQWNLSLLGGMSFFHLAEISNQLGVEGLRNGLTFQLSTRYRLTSKWALGLYGTYVSKGLTAVNDLGQSTYVFSVTGFPVELAGEYWILDRPNVTIRASVAGGLGLLTQFSSTAVQWSAPNVTTYSGMPITAVVRVAIGWRVSGQLHLELEAGYRLLNTGVATPVQTGNGSSIFENSSGEALAFPVNLSGPQLLAGMSYFF